MRRRVLAMVAVGTFTLGGALIPASIAEARIVAVDTECSNPAGHLPPGQQPTCTGGGLTQETENQNPAGHAPPGHNK
jgi:hypothetical protein